MGQNFGFTKAVKDESKLRLAAFGTSGSGKTWTSLQIATGLLQELKAQGKVNKDARIATIDSEKGRARKYGDRFDFDVLELTKKDIDTYVAAIRAASTAGYPVLIVDSLTHAWYTLLEEINVIAKAKYGGNTWAAWSDGNPIHRRLLDALLDYDGHIICTMRAKTEWEQVEVKGRKRPQRMGTAPTQGKDIEYEFDLLIHMTVDHNAIVITDHTGRFQDAVIEKPDAEFGVILAQWLSDGAKLATNEQKDSIRALLKELGITTPEKIYDALTSAGFRPIDKLNEHEVDALMERLTKAVADKKPEKPKKEEPKKEEPKKEDGT